MDGKLAACGIFLCLSDENHNFQQNDTWTVKTCEYIITKCIGKYLIINTFITKKVL